MASPLRTDSKSAASCPSAIEISPLIALDANLDAMLLASPPSRSSFFTKVKEAPSSVF